MNEDSKFIREPGLYAVKVLRAEKTKSKAGNAMLVVTFVDKKDREIRAYFVATNQWGLKALSDFKAAMGLPDTAKSEQFVGRELRISVVFQDPNKTGGKVFTNVAGYLPLESGDVNEHGPLDQSEELPF